MDSFFITLNTGQTYGLDNKMNILSIAKEKAEIRAKRYGQEYFVFELVGIARPSDAIFEEVEK